MNIQELYALYQQYPQVSTDTRNILPGSIFFALKGEKFNANSFAHQALSAGASYVVLDEAQELHDERFIRVADVLETLQELAHYHRKQLSIPFIGITGTNGKTTTKELLNAVLSEQYNTYATKGNLNNHIGVPLTLLAIDETVEMAIIEMGANHPEEIAFLCAIAAPTHGLITNVGKAHLEGFGSFEGVKKTKAELYDYLKAHQGVLFLQGDNADLVAMEAERGVERLQRYGFSSINDVQGKLIEANPLLTIAWHTQDAPQELSTVATHLVGSYNTENILAAVAVGLYFDLPKVAINKGIAGYIPTNNRSQISKTAHNIILADYYNANASSMAAALDNLAVITAKHKVLILGDMFEMGAESFFEHQQVIAKATALGAQRCIFVGHAFYAQRDDGAEFYATTEDAKAALLKRPIKDSTILLKASRGMAFERLMDVL